MAYTDENFEKLSKCCEGCRLAGLGEKIDLLISDIAEGTPYSGDLLSATEIAYLENMCEAGRLNSLGTVLNNMLTASKNYNEVAIVSDAVKVSLNSACEAFNKTSLGTTLQTAAVTINEMAEYDDSFIESIYFTGFEDYEGVIDNTAETIAIAIPYGNAKTALVANFTASNGATVSIGGTDIVSGTGEVDYSSPVTMVCTSEDESTSIDYTVTVTVSENTEAELLTFSVGGATGTIDEEAKTVTAEVANGTGLVDLVATFTTSDNAVVTIGGVTQESGVTTNTYTATVSYVVTSEDAENSQTYVVTVTEATE